MHIIVYTVLTVLQCSKCAFSVSHSLWISVLHPHLREHKLLPFSHLQSLLRSWDHFWDYPTSTDLLSTHRSCPQPPFFLKSEHQYAFDTLCKDLVSPPIQDYPMKADQLILSCNASDSGLGAILSTGQGTVIKYAKRNTLPQRRLLGNSAIFSWEHCLSWKQIANLCSGYSRLRQVMLVLRNWRGGHWNCGPSTSQCNTVLG